MDNKIKIYQYDNKFYIQTADSKIYEYNKDTKELSETFSKKEFGVAFYNGEIKIGKEDWKDLTAAALSMEGVKFSEKGKLAQQFDKEYKQAETGIRAFDSENINRRGTPEKEEEKKEHENPDLVYSTDRDTGIMRADVSYQGKSVAKFNGQGMDTLADVRGDEGDGPTGEHGKFANDINNNDWVPEDVAEAHGLDDEFHGDLKTPDQEKFTIKDLPKEVPMFYSPIVEDREEEMYDPDDPSFDDPRWSN